jgi:hypothetical protein
VEVWDGLWGPIFFGGSKMFVEYSSDGQIVAAYVEQQYPDQIWVPPSNETLQAFLADVPRLGKDAKGTICLLPAPSPPTLPEPCSGKKAATRTKLDRARVSGQLSSMAKLSSSLSLRFAVALYEESQHEPMPWRWLGDIAERAGMRRRDQLELALESATAAGWLIVHQGRSVTLTAAGIKAARRSHDGARDAQSPALAGQLQPTSPTKQFQLQA